MTMDWYLYDQNICHVKFGSFSHSQEDLVFFNGDNTTRHTFAKAVYKDYKFKMMPLCDLQTEETVKDAVGESSVFKVSGFSLVISQLVKMLQQWSLYEVIEDILLFVLNTKRPLSDIWLLRYKQNGFGCF